MSTAKPRPQTHGRPTMTVGDHGKIRETDLGARAGAKRFVATCRYRDRDGVTRQVSRRGTSAAKARAALQEALRNRAGKGGGSTQLGPSSRYVDALALYRQQLDAEVAAGTLAPTSRATYLHWTAKHIEPALGQLRLIELDPATIEDFLAELPVGASAKRTVRAVLRASLQIAVRRRALNHNPARELGRIRDPRRRHVPRALTTDERRDLLTRLGEDRHARRADLPDIVEVMLGTGLRIGELMALRWCDVDLLGVMVDGKRVPVLHVTGTLVYLQGEGLVRQETKTAASERSVPLPAFAVRVLRDRYARRPDWADALYPVFPGELGRWRWPNNVRRAWRTARDRAGYGWVVPHTWRKTAATALEAQGLTVRERADFLGHANLSTTLDVYTGRGEVHPAAASALDRAYGTTEPDRVT